MGQDRISNNSGAGYSRFWNLVTITLLAVWLVTPGIAGLIEPDRATSESENRALAQWPGAPRSFAAAPAWISELADYLRDQIGFREAFTTAHAYGLFSVGVSSNPVVLIGKDGFLFARTVWNRDDVLDAATGRSRLTDQQVNRVIDRLLDNERKAAEYGAVYVAVIVPMKLSVYRSKLPDWLASTVADDRMLNQLVEAAKARNAPLVDPTSSIVEMTDERLTWRKRDTHWNDAGAWAGFRAIAAEVNSRAGHDLFSIDEKDFRFRRARKRGGNLARMMGVHQFVGERSVEVVFNEPVLGKTVSESKDGSFRQFSLKTNRTGAPRVLIGSDSFIWRFMTFLSASSSEIWRETSSTLEIDWESVEAFRPDVIISLNTENALVSLQ